MRPRSVLMLVILVGVAMFAALNWSAFSAPTTLSLGLWSGQGPLGLILLGVIAALTLLYLVLLAWIEGEALLEARRAARELVAQRQLAENAEASRFEELRKLLQAELEALRTAGPAAAQLVIERLDGTETALRADIERAGNTLAAYIGELEERLHHSGPEAS